MGRGGERRANVLKSISSSSSSAVSTNYNNNPAEIFKKILYHVVKDAINSLFRATQSVCIRSVFSCGFSELLCVSSTTTSSSSSSFPQYNTVFFFSAVTFPFREFSSFYSPFSFVAFLANLAGGLFSIAPFLPLVHVAHVSSKFCRPN